VPWSCSCCFCRKKGSLLVHKELWDECLGAFKVLMRSLVTRAKGGCVMTVTWALMREGFARTSQMNLSFLSQIQVKVTSSICIDLHTIISLDLLWSLQKWNPTSRLFPRHLTLFETLNPAPLTRMSNCNPRCFPILRLKSCNLVRPSPDKTFRWRPKMLQFLWGVSSWKKTPSREMFLLIIIINKDL
jgi:hypothetical protein